MLAKLELAESVAKLRLAVQLSPHFTVARGDRSVNFMKACHEVAFTGLWREHSAARQPHSGPVHTSGCISLAEYP